MKPFRHILGIACILGGDGCPPTRRNSMKPFRIILGLTEILGDSYPQAFENSMKPFRNIVGIPVTLGGIIIPKLLEIPWNRSETF